MEQGTSEETGNLLGRNHRLYHVGWCKQVYYCTFTLSAYQCSSGHCSIRTFVIDPEEGLQLLPSSLLNWLSGETRKDTMIIYPALDVISVTHFFFRRVLVYLNRWPYYKRGGKSLSPGICITPSFRPSPKNLYIVLALAPGRPGLEQDYKHTPTWTWVYNTRTFLCVKRMPLPVFLMNTSFTIWYPNHTSRIT